MSRGLNAGQGCWQEREPKLREVIWQVLLVRKERREEWTYILVGDTKRIEITSTR